MLRLRCAMVSRNDRRTAGEVTGTLLLHVLALLVCAVPLHAQDAAAAAIGLGGLDNLLRRVESIDIYYGGSVGRPEPSSSSTSTRLPWGKDYGLEFLVHIAEVGPLTPAHQRRADDIERRRRLSLDSLRTRRGSPATPNSRSSRRRSP
jgi:hypothetical protein